MGKLFIAFGYDTEYPYGQKAFTTDGQESLRRHLDFINNDLSKLLDSENVPRTHFILGEHLLATLGATNADAVRETYKRPLIEVGQHSYSHPIIAQVPGSKSKARVVSLDEYLEDIGAAQKVLSSILDVKPSGLRTPVGYPCDLTGLPELSPELKSKVFTLLNGLSSIGLDYVSSDLRGRTNSYKGEMVLDRQPHIYPLVFWNINYNPLVEVPSHGFQDNVFSEANKTDVALGINRLPTQEEIVGFYNHLFNEAKTLASITEKPIFVNLCLHPQAVMTYDPNLEVHKRKIDQARKLGMEFVTYGKVAEITRVYHI